MEVLNPVAGRAQRSPGDLSRDLLDRARSLHRESRSAGEPVESLAAELHGVDPGDIAGDPARKAFWMNLYNALFLHATSVRPVRLHLALRPRLFRTVAYRVGGCDYTLDAVEHGVLRRNRRPHRARAPVLDDGDERLRAAPGSVDARIHFALNCGARSCPPIRAYDATGVDEQLRAATASYLATEVSVDRARGRVRLPGLMRIYHEDFGGREELVAFAAHHLPGDEGAWLAAHAARVRVRYRRFDARVAR